MNEQITGAVFKQMVLHGAAAILSLIHISEPTRRS